MFDAVVTDKAQFCQKYANHGDFTVDGLKERSC